MTEPVKLGPCTVYYLISEGTVVYVGLTCRTRNRVREHSKTKVYDAVKYFTFQDRAKASKFERESVETYNPKYNKHLKVKPAREAMNCKLTRDNIKRWHMFAINAGIGKEEALNKIIEIVTE